MFTKQALGALVLACLSVVTAASEVDVIDIKANFTNYWSAMAHSDFKGAARYVHPLDLSGMRTAVLPVFLEANDSPKGGVHGAADLFFGSVPKERRGNLSGPEVFVLLQQMVANAEPSVIKLFAQTQPEVVEVQQDGNTAKIRYRITIDGEDAEATQDAGKFNGRWYINMSESPKDAAAKLRKELR
jgi:hypothetical protein